VRGHTRRDGHFALNFALLCLNTQETRLRDLCFGGDRVQPAAGLPMSMSLDHYRSGNSQNPTRRATHRPFGLSFRFCRYSVRRMSPRAWH
jgi:hypothetical protein